jgi:hypothetical protein
MIWIILSMQRKFIHPYAYSIIILLFTIVTTTLFILLLLLSFCYCYYYKTVATDKRLRASLLPGAAELITHLLRLINILWLPLCRINKFRFYFPRRLLRSPILVGHHFLSTHPLEACVPEPTYFASSYQTNPPRWFILVEVLNLFTKQLLQGDHSKASIFKVFSDMGWPDLLVSDAMVMMAADDCRG